MASKFIYNKELPMKQIFLLFLLLPFYLDAKSHFISNIPLPKTYIMNLDPYPCDEACMAEYLENGMIFSFLSHATAKLDNPEQNDIRMINIAVLNLGSTLFKSKVKIAMLLPYKKIGRYASSTTNAAFAYLITKNYSFELKSYKIKTESREDIINSLEKIKSDGFSYVIAPFTTMGANIVAEINPKINIYFPTVNKNNVISSTSSLYYGAIDYEAQSDQLLKEAVSPLVIFNDRSLIGKKLSKYQESQFKLQQDEENNSISLTGLFSLDDTEDLKVVEDTKRVINFSIPKRTTNLESKLKENLDINDGSFFINTPVVKTGMIMSQLTLYDTNVTNILSTQINYDPLLLSMTQYQDRKKMIIANSITKQNNVLIDANSLLGNDIVYDWINYTTTVGTDYFFNMITGENREYNIPLDNNQMIHDIELVQPVKARFIKHIVTTLK